MAQLLCELGGIMLLLAVLMLAPGAEQFADLIPSERLSSGPHTLMISDGQAIARTEYRTGPACMKARDAVRRQVAQPADTPTKIYGPPRVQAFCAPR